MANVRIGTIPYASNARSSELYVDVNQPIKELFLRLTGSQTNPAGGTTLLSGGAARLVKKVEVLRGGEVVASYGINSAVGSAGRLIPGIVAALFGFFCEAVDATLTVGTFAFSNTFVIPFALPRLLYPSAGRLASCLTHRNRGRIAVVVYWGTHTDISTDVTAVSSVEVEVIAVCAEQAVTPTLTLHSVTQPLIPADGIQTADTFELNKNGMSPFVGMFLDDNGTPSDVGITRMRFLQNSVDVIQDGSWQAYKQRVAALAGIQISTVAGFGAGANAAIFDAEGQGKEPGLLNLDDTRKWQSFRLETAHIDLNTTALLLMQHYGIRRGA